MRAYKPSSLRIDSPRLELPPGLIQPRKPTLHLPDVRVVVAPPRGPEDTSASSLGATMGLVRNCVFGTVAGMALLLGGCATTGVGITDEPERMQPGIVQREARIDTLDPELRGTSAGTVQSAHFLIDQHADHYREQAAWYNLDPAHPLPTNVELTGMTGKSKCNLFVLQSVYLGGFEPPRYGNGAGGEYANANQMWKWGDAAAVTFGNPVRFETVAEAPLADASRREKIDRITEVLRQAEPGDLVLVDHGPKANGERVVNRGHARVVLNNPLAKGGNVIEVAHATDLRGAVVERETPSELAHEHHIWVLRPNVTRAPVSALATNP